MNSSQGLWIGVVEFAFVARTGAAAMLQRRAGGLVVRTRTVKAVHNRSRIHDIAVANEPIGIPIGIPPVAAATSHAPVSITTKGLLPEKHCAKAGEAPN